MATTRERVTGTLKPVTIYKPSIDARIFGRGAMKIQIRGLAALKHMIHRLRQSNRYKEGGVANVCPPPPHGTATASNYYPLQH